jgi:hypothetical protein
LLIFFPICRPASPDFLSGLVALANFMRLSLRKAAYVVLDGAAMQEIRLPLPLAMMTT